MSRTRQRQVPAALAVSWLDGSDTGVSPVRSRPHGLVLVAGLLAAFSAPTPVHAQIPEAKRALLGTVPAGPTAGGPMEVTPGPSLPDGAAALLNNRRVAIRPAGPSRPSAADPLVDGARALLNGGPRSGQGRPSVASTSADTGEPDR